MGKTRIQRYPLALVFVGMMALLIFLPAQAANQPDTTTDQGRADIIAIDGLKLFGPLERSAVVFLHDKHTEAAAKQGKDCLACHPKVEGALSLKFQRTEDTDRQTVMDIYHDQCIACHRASRSSQNPSGPQTCGECHVNTSSVQSNWQTFGLDKSLHYRHSKANENKCERCHHEYNAETKTLFHAKGREGACLYCHGDKTEENRISNREASHLACIGCHSQQAAQQKDAGPMDCGGCHDPQQQGLIEKVADIPRMERNQPDVTLVNIVARDPSVEQPPTRMAPVPFDHKAHEQSANSCRVCHHASLSSCAGCHTLQGHPDGKQVKLAQAMHQNDATMSCIGCHTITQARPQCAGCHTNNSGHRSLTAEAACQVCHVSVPMENPLPKDDAQIQTLAAELRASRPTMENPVPADQIPETVTIKQLADQYEAVALPHRKIVLKLAEMVRDDRLAAQFHTDATTLCQGCHHNSPASLKPPQCGSCHGRSSEALNLTRPGLLAAYHQQCLECHDRMGIEKPAARECTACHPKRKS